MAYLKERFDEPLGKKEGSQSSSRGRNLSRDLRRTVGMDLKKERKHEDVVTGIRLSTRHR